MSDEVEILASCKFETFILWNGITLVSYAAAGIFIMCAVMCAKINHL